MQHIMPSRVFNTHAAVKRLQDAGADDRLAEAVVATLGAAVSEHVATKTDIPTLTAGLSWRPSSTRQSSRSRRWSTGARRTISSGRCAVGSSDSSAPAGSPPRPWKPSPPTSWPSPRYGPTDDCRGDLRHHLGRDARSVRHLSQRQAEEDGGGDRRSDLERATRGTGALHYPPARRDCESEGRVDRAADQTCGGPWPAAVTARVRQRRERAVSRAPLSPEGPSARDRRRQAPRRVAPRARADRTPSDG